MTDGSLLSLAGRVVMPLAIALVLLGSGTSAQPGRTGAPPGQLAAVHLTPPPHGVLGGRPPPVRAAARHGQRNRTGVALVAMLAAALAGALAATTRPELVSRSRRLDRRLPAPRPRAPPPPSRRA